MEVVQEVGDALGAGEDAEEDGVKTTVVAGKKERRAAEKEAARGKKGMMPKKVRYTSLFLSSASTINSID